MSPRPFLLVLGTLVAGFTRPAQAEGAAWTAGGTVVTQYLFRGLRYGGAALQPNVEFAAADFTAGVWGSTPLAAKVPGRSDPEIDPYLSYRWRINDHVTVLPAATAYLYPRAEPRHGFHRATFEPALAVSYVGRIVAVTPRLYYDTVRRGPTAELSATSAVPLGAIGTEVDFSATAGTYRWLDAVADAFPRTKWWGDYWQLGATVPYQLGASRLSLGFSYAGGERAYMKSGDAPRRVNPLAARRGIVTLTYSRSF